MIPISIAIIILIESSGNPLAHNINTDARGLMQITPIVLADYNKIKHKDIKEQQLWFSDINISIGEWYLTKRIPQLLRHYKKPITLRNILIAYNAGIKYAGKRNIPRETIKYIMKYKRLYALHNGTYFKKQKDPWNIKSLI